jgi:formamidopyrimidine-DNA glycosylase
VPELPDISSYLVALRRQIVGKRIERIQVRSPFLVRTVSPELDSLVGEAVLDLSRIGKRIIWHFAGDRFLVFHLMIAGRFHLKKPGVKPTGKKDLAAVGFDDSTLMLTEASQKKRASLHLVVGRDALKQFDRGGIDPLDCSLAQFMAALRRENHTLKRSLADPRLLSGIGNAYSDEILFAAKLSPVLLTSRMTDEQLARLFSATQGVLHGWIDRLNREAAERFPE